MLALEEVVALTIIDADTDTAVVGGADDKLGGC